MTRQSRMLLVTGLLGLGAVLALGGIANRYSELLERQSGDAQLVDRYIRVRSAVRRGLDEDPGGAGVVRRLRTVRDRELSAARMSRGSYRSVRDSYRVWKSNPAGVPHELAAAFERNRQRLAAVELGPYESSGL